MRRRPNDEVGQLQLLESILVAVFIFIAIAVVAIYRLPTNPGTFQASELQNVGVDTLKVRQAKIPAGVDDCNESPCPFYSDLDRIWSLALGYRGPTWSTTGEDPTTAELKSFLDQALPAGARYIFTYSNGYNHTNLLPRNATPPAADVVVARTVVTPNWTVNASFAGVGPALRLGESSDLSGVTFLIDPLGRNQTETGASLASLFSGTVPLNATFGTYRACHASGCGWIDVVPPGMPGPGSFVLDPSTEIPGPLKTWGRLDSLLRYNNTDGDGSFTSADRVYLSPTGGSSIASGDVRLALVPNCRATLACAPGSTVRAGDVDLDGALLAVPSATINYSAASAALSTSTPLVLDADGDGQASSTDILVTRQAWQGMGNSTLYSGTALNQGFATNTVWAAWWDEDGNGTREEQEPLYLNLTTDAQTEGLEPYDVVVSPHRLPSRLWAYDIRVVIWYGV